MSESHSQKSSDSSSSGSKSSSKSSSGSKSSSSSKSNSDDYNYSGQPEMWQTKFDNINKSIEKRIKKMNNLENILPTTFIQKDPECIRKFSNFSYPKNYSMFYNLIDYTPSKSMYEKLEISNANDLKQHIENMKTPEMRKDFIDTLKLVSPKVLSLIEKIQALDKKDMEQYGKKFKHFIFSDSKSSMSGVKLLASSLIAMGMDNGYSAEPHANGKKKWGKMKLHSNEELEKTKYNNFYMLSSKSVYDEPISVTNKKEMLARFNERPENVYGKNTRIILMDGGYKEGIDLFDIKYIHIFEPTVTQADQKQVIGRGTRTCGQKGLDFHPLKGWPLYVYIYDLKMEYPFDKALDASSGIEMYFKARNMNIKLLNFSSELEMTCIQSAVDAELNQNIHSFSIPMAEEDDSFRGGGSSKSSTSSRNSSFFGSKLPQSASNLDFTIDKPLNAIQMRQYIRDYFSKYSWDSVKMENNCIPKKQSGGATIMNYTPTQAFVSNFFTPTNPLKGMLLWHSVGTGKTCTAIATATSSFEKQGYTILWVTRTTLKNDIWKNMFDQVCHEIIKLKVENGVVIPSKNADRMKMLSKSWKIRPMSYKQFSNLVSKKNKIYETIVKINGQEDPLRKTLLVIDEAHKLYGGGDLSSIETPDMVALHAALMNSYAVSGKDSVKLLLMTATPIQTDPMELIKLINLFKLPDSQIPNQFELFSEKYLDSEGRFKASALTHFRDEIAGHISYLNREKDARQFSQPIVSIVKANIYDTYLLERNKKATYKVYSAVQKNIEKELKTLKSNPILKATAPVGFEKYKKQCESYEVPKARTACKKVVSGHKKNATLRFKMNKLDVKSNIRYFKNYASAMRNVMDSKIFDAEYDEENSPITFRSGEHEVTQKDIDNVYNRLSTKCSKTKHDDASLIQNAIENNEDIAHLTTLIDDLKKDINQNESIIKKEKNKVTKKALRDTIVNDKNILKKHVNTLKKEKKKYIKHVKTVVKKTKKKLAKNKKTLKKIVKKMKYHGIYTPELDDPELKKTMDEDIHQAVDSILLAQREKENKKQEKKDAAAAKKEEATRKKREKQEAVAAKKEEATRKKRAKDEEAERKNPEAFRKKTEAAAKKKEEQARAKQEKEQEKERAKQEKEREQERAKQENEEREKASLNRKKREEALNRANNLVCPSEGKQPTRCNTKKDLIKQSLIFHPDKNRDCTADAKIKFQNLQNMCSHVS